MNTDNRLPITVHEVVAQRHYQSPINGSTQLLGIIGWPVTHSFSPAMHNAALADLGLNYVYIPLPVPPDAVATAVPALPALGFRGVNVTVPHKQAVIPLLDEIEDAAKAIGAINTIVINRLPITDHRILITGSTMTGYNTDWAGFLADLAERGVLVNGRDCLVLGAGGAARAVAYALATSGGRVQVLSRRPGQAAELTAALRPTVSIAIAAGSMTDLATIAPNLTAPLIVNTTPLGTSPQPENSPWPANLPLPPGAYVYDLVYNPRETTLMRQAQAAGLQTANGLGMLVHQGVRAFELWTGQTPNVPLMRTVIG